MESKLLCCNRFPYFLLNPDDEAHSMSVGDDHGPQQVVPLLPSGPTAPAADPSIQDRFQASHVFPSITMSEEIQTQFFMHFHPTFRKAFMQTQLDERIEQVRRFAQAAPIPRSQTHVQAPNILGPLVCKAMIGVMNRGQDPRSGVWHPHEFKTLMSQHGTEMPEDYCTGHINERFFIKSRENGQTRFTALPGSKPSEGLAQFFRGPTIATGEMTAIACAYHAFVEQYGAERFDQMFSDADPFTIENAALDQFFEHPPSCKQGAYGNRPLHVGDLCWFENVPWYLNKHPAGMGAGLYVVYSGLNEHAEQLFVGLGLEKPSTEREIIQWLIRDYNQKRSADDIMAIEQAMDDASFSMERQIFLRYADVLDSADPRTLEYFEFVRFIPECTLRVKELS
jgi:hypothetical protein